jgi:hypothetical protein
LLGLSRSFSFLILYTVDGTYCTGDQPVARPLPTHMTTQIQNKHTETSTPRVGFKPTTPVIERAKSSCLRSRGGRCDRYEVNYRDIVAYKNESIVTVKCTTPEQCSSYVVTIRTLIVNYSIPPVDELVLINFSRLRNKLIQLYQNFLDVTLQAPNHRNSPHENRISHTTGKITSKGLFCYFGVFSSKE